MGRCSPARRRLQRRLELSAATPQWPRTSQSSRTPHVVRCPPRPRRDPLALPRANSVPAHQPTAACACQLPVHVPGLSRCICTRPRGVVATLPPPSHSSLPKDHRLLAADVLRFPLPLLPLQCSRRASKGGNATEISPSSPSSYAPSKEVQVYGSATTRSGTAAARVCAPEPWKQ